MVGSSCNGPSTNNALYWKQEPTAIFILWDDWGGWFDHVQPWAVYRDAGGTQCLPGDAPNGWGCGYTSGFRVPLLVVSPYYTQPGYVSGACGASGCTNDQFPYQHDFGSILAFTEVNFGLKSIDQGDSTGYADLNAPDNQKGNVPLSDFFGSTFHNTFTPINTLQPYTCFQNFGSCTGTTYVPDGPDGDDGD
jgi:Phosphoesterase family